MDSKRVAVIGSGLGSAVAFAAAAGALDSGFKILEPVYDDIPEKDSPWDGSDRHQRFGNNRFHETRAKARAKRKARKQAQKAARRRA